MPESKQTMFLRGLCDKSAKGNVRWESTGDEDTFLASFGAYAVLISGSILPYEADQGFDVRILDAEGEIIDAFSDSDFATDDKPEARRLLKELFLVARRKALGVDEVYEKLLHELGAE